MGRRVNYSNATSVLLLLLSAFVLTCMIHSAKGVRPIMEGSGSTVSADEVDRRLYKVTVGSPGPRMSLVEVNDSGPSPGGGGHTLVGA